MRVSIDPDFRTSHRYDGARAARGERGRAEHELLAWNQIAAEALVNPADSACARCRSGGECAAILDLAMSWSRRRWHDASELDRRRP